MSARSAAETKRGNAGSTSGIRDVMVRRRNVGRCHVGAGSRADIPGWWHHLGIKETRPRAVMETLARSGRHSADSTRIWVVVDAEMASEFIRSTEAF